MGTRAGARRRVGRRIRRTLLALLAASWLGACALNPWHEPQTVFTKLLQIRVADNANLNQSIAFDLVIVKNKELLEKLLGLSAQDWFAQREQWKRDHPADLSTWEWELVPGKDAAPFRLGGAGAVAGVLVFAGYTTEGAHRARLDPYEVITIEFGEKGFALHPVYKL